MLQLAGLEMDIDPPLQWKRLAHETAHYLHGSQIRPDQVMTLPHTHPPCPPTVEAACPRDYTLTVWLPSLF